MEFEQALETVIGIFARTGITNTTDLVTCSFQQKVLIAECVIYKKLDKTLLVDPDFQQAIINRLRENDHTEIYIVERIESGEIKVH